MTQEKETFEQQILFDEPVVIEQSQELSGPSAQVVIEQEDFQLIEDYEEVEEAAIVELDNASNWPIKIGLSIFLIIILVEMTLFFVEGFTNQPIIASLYAMLLGFIVLVFSRSAYHEFKGLRALKRQDDLRKQFDHVKNDDSTRDARAICDLVAKNIPCDLTSQQVQNWSDAVPVEMNNTEVLELFTKQVLMPADKKVLDKISKFSTEAVVLVSLSPIAIVDMGIMFWRNLKMINEIANLYGMKIGYWSRIKLIKQVFVNMVYAGASELIADLGADLLGADLLGKLSARLAQGLGAGMLTARLGLQTMKLCRPVAFEPSDAPKLKTIRKQIMTKIMSLTKKD